MTLILTSAYITVAQACALTVVDRGRDVRLRSPIAIGADGLQVIWCHDGTNTELKI